MTFPRISLLSKVSSAHLVSHVHLMALPAVLPLLPGHLGVGFVELGLALSIFNIVSALVQAPLGFAVDRFGARRVLTFGLLIGSASFLSLALFPSYGWLLVAMALAGFANGVYHPADYALLSTGIDERRMGRAFSVHTFAGYLGSAIAPGMLLGLAAWEDTRLAFAAAGLAGFSAIALLWAPGPSGPARAAEPPRTAGSASAGRRARGSSVLTPGRSWSSRSCSSC